MYELKRIVSFFIPAFFLIPVCIAQVEVEHVEKRVRNLGLSTISIEETTVFFDKPDSIRGREFAGLRRS